MEKTTWLLPIVVVLKKYGNLHICVDFKILIGAIYKGGFWYGN
jgi:hypothetical protein